MWGRIPLARAVRQREESTQAAGFHVCSFLALLTCCKIMPHPTCMNLSSSFAMPQYHCLCPTASPLSEADCFFHASQQSKGFTGALDTAAPFKFQLAQLPQSPEHQLCGVPFRHAHASDATRKCRLNQGSCVGFETVGPCTTYSIAQAAWHQPWPSNGTSRLGGKCPAPSLASALGVPRFPA